jgi:hypothetical protein
MNDANRYRLTTSQHEQIFREEILPDLTSRLQAVKQPRAAILGGQPGAGKSALQSALEHELAPGGGVLSIVGDDLRAYHPRYRALMRADDKTAAFYTDRDSAGWIEKLIEHAKAMRFNLVIESTMRVSDKNCATAESLRNVDYTTEAHVLAVHRTWSILGIHQRYEAMLRVHGHARFTLQKSHDEAYAGMLKTIDDLERRQLVDHVVVYKRGNVTLYESNSALSRRAQPGAAHAAIERERRREWTAPELFEVSREWKRIWTARSQRYAARADIEFARKWYAHALLAIRCEPKAQRELARELSPRDYDESQRFAAGAAFAELQRNKAVQLFPAIERYFAALDNGREGADARARLRHQLEQRYPEPPKIPRNRDRDRGPER